MHQIISTALYGFAESLIKEGKAYVDSQSAEDIRNQRGSLTQGGPRQPLSGSVSCR